MKKLEELFASITPAQGGRVEYLLVGLGNPGKEYENTRHNAGYLALDYITQKENIPMRRVRFQSLSGEGTIAGKRVLCLKPTTYMNNSGEAVREAAQFYKIPMEQVIVLCDDIMLDPGVLRIRRKGSDGGQKGLRSIAQHTGTQEFPRIRLGIGRKPHPQMDLAAWVLSKFTTAEEEKMQQVYENTWQAVQLILQGDMEEAMARYN